MVAMVLFELGRSPLPEDARIMIRGEASHIQICDNHKPFLSYFGPQLKVPGRLILRESRTGSSRINHGYHEAMESSSRAMG